MSRHRPLFSGREPSLDNAFWSATAGEAPPLPQLTEHHHRDVLVIGGGFNGVTCALRLAEQGASVALLEAAEPGAGATGRNAGMVNPGQFLGPEEIENTLGKDYGERFVAQLGGAPELVRGLINRLGIECDRDERPIIRAAHNLASARFLERQAAAWQARDMPVEIVERDALAAMTGTRCYRNALLDYRGFTVQPLAYIRGLTRAAIAAGADIYAHSPVIRLWRDGQTWRAATPLGQVSAERVVLSTNAYTAGLLPEAAAETLPVGAFGFASAPLSPEHRARILISGHSLYDTHRIPLFLRYDREGRLMVGCLGCLPWRAGKADTRWADRVIRRLFPEIGPLVWQYRWSGTLGLTPNRLPHLVQPAPGLLATVGCNGRGIAPNTFFGHMLADMALGKTDHLPLPLKAPRGYPLRSVKMTAYDLAMRLYRNTFLFHFH